MSEEKKDCFCEMNDAWRCARARNLTDCVACPCVCHRRLRPEGDARPDQRKQFAVRPRGYK